MVPQQIGLYSRGMQQSALYQSDCYPMCYVYCGGDCRISNLETMGIHVVEKEVHCEIYHFGTFPRAMQAVSHSSKKVKNSGSSQPTAGSIGAITLQIRLTASFISSSNTLFQ